MILTKTLQRVYAATIDRSKFREIASRVVVFVLPLFYSILNPGRAPWWIGLVVVGLGLLIRAWGAGYLQKDQTMAAGGPYLIVRHPLYLGSILLALGLILSMHHWFVTLLIGGVTFLVYWHTIRHEEQNLIARFGKSYVDYQKLVGPLWPRLGGLKIFFGSNRAARGSFSFAQYLKNKEYECLLGVLVVLGFLYFFSR